MTSARTLTIALLALILCAPAAAQRLYKYIDANGNVVYTDKLPASAAGKATEHLNRQGTVVRRTDAALTPEELVEQERKRVQRLQEEMAAREQKRKDMALLNTYTAVEDIEAARVRALEANEVSIKATERIISENEKRRAQLASHAETYKDKPMPAGLQRDIKETDLALKANAEVLEAKRKETTAINTRFDEDKRRFVELTQARQSAGRTLPPVATGDPDAKK